MYELKEITLKNKGYEKKRLVIRFFEEKYAILAEFLMSDAKLLSNELELAFDKVQSDKADKIVLTGNRCAVEINKTKTEITDLYEDLNQEGFQPLTISTESFQRYVNMWQKNLIEFNQINNK